MSCSLPDAGGIAAVELLLSVASDCFEVDPKKRPPMVSVCENCAVLDNLRNLDACQAVECVKAVSPPYGRKCSEGIPKYLRQVFKRKTGQDDKHSKCLRSSVAFVCVAIAVEPGEHMTQRRAMQPPTFTDPLAPASAMMENNGCTGCSCWATAAWGSHG